MMPVRTVEHRWQFIRRWLHRKLKDESRGNFRGAPKEPPSPASQADHLHVAGRPKSHPASQAECREFESLRPLHSSFKTKPTWLVIEPVFDDVTAAWSTVGYDVGDGSICLSWVIALQRDFPTSNTSAIRLYQHPYRGGQLNSGTTTFVSLPAGRTHTRPSIGGNRFGVTMLLVYQEDLGTNPAVSPATTVVGHVLDSCTPSVLGPPFVVKPNGAYATWDPERPQVSHRFDSSDSWPAAS